MCNLAISGLPLKGCKRNSYNTGSLSEQLISFTVCVSFFIGYSAGTSSSVSKTPVYTSIFGRHHVEISAIYQC